MRALIAGLWLPVSTVTTHFASADKLGFSPEEAFAIGVESGVRIQHSVLQTLRRLAAGAGATPWTVLHQYGRLWARVFEGGGVCEYFRNAFRGSNYAGLSLFARTLHVREDNAFRTSAGFALRASRV
jgi:hypothetical protein